MAPVSALARASRERIRTTLVQPPSPTSALSFSTPPAVLAGTVPAMQQRLKELRAELKDRGTDTGAPLDQVPFAASEAAKRVLPPPSPPSSSTPELGFGAYSHGVVVTVSPRSLEVDSSPSLATAKACEIAHALQKW